MDPFIRIADSELVLPGMIGSRVFLHISDTHISVWDGESTAEERAEAEEKDRFWMEERNQYARKFGEPFENARNISTGRGFGKLLAFARDVKPDALLLTGDNLEWMHPAGERFLRDSLYSLGIPFLCVPGNHEADVLPGVFGGGLRVLEYGDFRIVGLNNRQKTVSDDDLNRLGELAEEGVPMIVCCHIPAASSCSRDTMRRFGEYFSIDPETADENGARFVHFLEEEPAVKMVLCGHIHGYSETEIIPGKRQITASQGMIGFVHRLTVRGEP